MIEALKGLFGASGIAKTGVNMLESAFFTDQERSKFMLEYLEQTKPQARTRRIIACVIAFLWLVCVSVLGVLFFVDNKLYGGWSGFMVDHINTPFSVIMGFYFLAHVVTRGKS